MFRIWLILLTLGAAPAFGTVIEYRFDAVTKIFDDDWTPTDNTGPGFMTVDTYDDTLLNFVWSSADFGLLNWQGRKAFSIDGPFFDNVWEVGVFNINLSGYTLNLYFDLLGSAPGESPLWNLDGAVEPFHTIGDGTSEWLLDLNITDSSVIKVPEPASLLLFATGLIAVGSAGRRRSRAFRQQLSSPL